MDRIINPIRNFAKSGVAGGVVLLVAAVLALIVNNLAITSPLYQAFLEIPVQVRIGALDIDKPLLLWINDGLMAIFFFLVGLELKRELVEGHLSNPAQAALPGMAAIGGIMLPALIYVFFNWGNEETIRGWAIPAATDIAFSLGLLALFGSRVPPALKIFLLALAIIDDIGAIMIIALFYTSELSTLALLGAAGFTVVLLVMNLSGITRISAYIIIGLGLWVCMLKSGVHATLGGVILAAFIPIKAPKLDYSPLKRLEHDLTPWVAFLVMPVFAFANAGVSFAGMSLSVLLEPVPLGIMLGLFVGKQLGAFTFAWIAVKSGMAKLSEGTTWLGIYAMCIICGIGFTMSLFIGNLAFTDEALLNQVRLGVLLGSLMSGVAGYLLLSYELNRMESRSTTKPATQH